jgi:formate dehydrogenase gamma subunit
LAKKNNKNADEIDLTTFAFAAAGDPKMPGVPGCGGCHPGGGGMEFDRDGKRFDKRLAAEPQLAQSLDGDYYQSKWDKTGVIEADCFICHLPGYNFKERNLQLQDLNFKWASNAASGIAEVTGKVKDGAQPKVTYNKRLFNEDGKIVLDLTGPPPSENCVFCHGMSDSKKRGFSWDDKVNHDIHNMRGMSCAACHPAIDKQHNFAKGDENVSSVRNDLDNTMKNCQQCHTEGYMGAPRPKHLSIRPNHLEKLACEVCHIPALHVAAAEGFDVTTGKIVNYPKIGAKKIGERFTWKPRYAKGGHKGEKIWPVNVMLPVTYTNLNKDGLYYPLYGKEIGKGYAKIQDKLKGKKPNKPELHTPEEIKLMLAALTETLKGNQRFQQVKPYYHKGGEIYFLNEKGEVASQKDHTWVGHTEGFNINHNVAPAGLALGAGGCGDCHSDTAHMFKGQIVTDMFGPEGKPVTISSGRLFGCAPWAFTLNQIHQLYLTPYVSWIILLLVFVLVLHYTGQGPKRVDFSAGPGEIQRFSLAERWTHLVRLLTFLVLFFTGYIFFYNNVTMLRLFFGSQNTAVIFHWVAGLIFVAASIVSLGLWYQDARFVSYDREWLKQRGGYVGGHELEVPAGRLNAGQKIFFWVTVLLSLIMGLTGILLIFKSSLPLTINCLLSTVHGFFAIIFVAAIVAHAYLGTIANPGTWSAMVDGKVSRLWAKKHHSEWYREISGPEQPAEAEDQPEER